MRIESQIDGLYLNTVARKLKWQITSGDEYLWECYPNARIMEFDDKSNKDSFHITVIFNAESLLVYEITGHGKLFSLTTDNEIWRWINLDYLRANIMSHVKRNIDPNRAYDNIDYEAIEEDELLRRIDIIAAS